ncbi:hypothetical protein H8356DRAFT_957499, partial [Neocallimastix lanati (nom. inval.)]
LKTAKCYNVFAKIIISFDVPKDELNHIKNLQNAFNIRVKLKEIYEGSENADIPLLIDK